MQEVSDYVQARAVDITPSVTENEAREAAASQRRLDRETEANERVHVCQDAEQALFSHASWLMSRVMSCRELVRSRKQRGITARHLALRTSGLPLQNYIKIQFSSVRCG